MEDPSSLSSIKWITFRAYVIGKGSIHVAAFDFAVGLIRNIFPSISFNTEKLARDEVDTNNYTAEDVLQFMKEESIETVEHKVIYIYLAHQGQGVLSEPAKSQESRPK